VGNLRDKYTDEEWDELEREIEHEKKLGQPDDRYLAIFVDSLTKDQLIELKNKLIECNIPRHQYWRTAESAKSLAIQRARAIQSTYKGMSFFNNSNKRFYNVSGHTNYINPVDSSLYIQKKRSNAVGKSTYKIGLPAEAPYSTKNYYPSGVRTSIRRVRSGGCVAPAKKGAIENTSLRNGQVCAWGAQGGGRPTY
jgi:hypothetical protein